MTVHIGVESFDSASEDLCAADDMPGSSPRPTLKAIREAICAHYGLRMNDLLSCRRAREVARPRQVGMYLAKRLTIRSLPEIGRHFGGRDHTTVIHAVRTIDRLCMGDLDLADDVAVLWKNLEHAAQFETVA